MMRLNSSGMNRGECRGRDEEAAIAGEGEGDVDELAIDEEESMIGISVASLLCLLLSILLKRGTRCRFLFEG